MSKIKIFYGITKGNSGGAQKYVYDLATHLPADIYEVSVVSGAPGLLCDKLKAQNIPVFVLRSLNRNINPLRDLTSFFSLLSLLRKIKPNILHLNSPKMGLLGAIAGRIYNLLTPKTYHLSIIYTSHGWPFYEYRPWLVKIFFRILCWKITWLCHEVIVISRAEQTNKNFHLIYNGISEINFLSKAEARQKLNLPENSEKLVIGTIAELHKNKGLEYLLAAMKNIDAKLVIIGGGELESELKLKASSYHLSPTFAGAIPDAARLLPAFDIFVLPSIKEGLPYVIAEAGLAGLPVIATRVGGIPEVIENNVNGILVAPKNVTELKLALEKLIKNPETRKTMGEKLRETIRNNFMFAKMLTETRGVYEK